MGASCVVVVHVSAERVLQVAMGEDQQVIEAMDTPSVRQMRSHVERAPACERSRSPRTEGPRRRQR
jgi:catabolite regulation protein CreA